MSKRDDLIVELRCAADVLFTATQETQVASVLDDDAYSARVRVPWTAHIGADIYRPSNEYRALQCLEAAAALEDDLDLDTLVQR